jgi:hypothetical protein
MIGNPLKIEDIISELSRGGIRIPEIQRDYVWKRSQIAKLLDSIYQEFPAGSILLWDTTDEIVMRGLATNLGQTVRSDFIPKVVLDGQQRITALARVFDVSTKKDERIIFNIVDEVFEPYSPRNAADPRWIDVTELLTDHVTELDALERLIEAGVINKNDRETKNDVHEHLKRLKAISKYQFPVEIVRSQDLESVTEVFIRVNSGGTRLRQAELALARLAWKVPGSIVGPFERMEGECVERGFDLDTRFLMRALIAVATRQSRFRDLKAFWERPAAEIERAWKRTENGLRLTLDFVEGNVEIPGTEFLPSQYSLIPLITIFANRDKLTASEERGLRRWFLRANAFSHYVGASETKLDQDLGALGTKCENISQLVEQLEHDQRGNPKINAEDLERSGTNSPFFPLAFLAVIRREATDWFKGIKLRRDSFADDQNVEYHHIFPKKLLNARNIDRYHRDEMANLAFLSQKANRKILSSKPADYLVEIAERAPERLEAQYVPMDRSLWEIDRFEDFLAARRKLLTDAMNEILEV